VESFVESTDGDTVINHGDWMFYASDTARLYDNGVAGLQNIMDLPGVGCTGPDIPWS